MEKLVKQTIGRYFVRKTLKWPKNWVLKLISFLFAFFLWYFVVGEEKVDMTINVPMEIVNLPRDLVISNQFKRELEVLVSGPRNLIRDITTRKITRTVDLSNAVPGTVEVRNEVTSIQFPRGITIFKVKPPQITLLLDRLIDKEIPIHPELVGEVAKGFELGEIKLTPSAIALTAPHAVLGPIQQFMTKPIDISGRKATFDEQVNLVLPLAVAELIGEPVVTARTVINEKIIQSTVSYIPIQFSHESVRTIYRMTPGSVEAKVKLPYSFGQQNPDLTSFIIPRIAAEGLPAGSYELDVTVTANPAITVVDYSPKKVILRISAPQPAMIIFPEDNNESIAEPDAKQPQAPMQKE